MLDWLEGNAGHCLALLPCNGKPLPRHLDLRQPSPGRPGMRYAEHCTRLHEFGLLHHLWPPLQKTCCALVVVERAPTFGQHEYSQAEACDGLALCRPAMMMILGNVHADATLGGRFEEFEVGRAGLHELPYVADFVLVRSCNGVDGPSQRGRKILIDLRLQGAARFSNCSAFFTAVRGRSYSLATRRSSPPSARSASTMAMVGTPDSERMG